MADIKIQELTSETSLSDNHLLITQENSDTAETKKTTLSLLKSFLNMLDFSDISQYFAEGTNVNIAVDNDMQKITISASATGEKGDKGDKGNDGFSPIVTIKQTETGATISITDVNGTTTANITNGITPHIDDTTKHWFVGDVDTGITAEGVTTISATSVSYTGTLNVEGWVGDTAPYTQDVGISGITSNLSPFIDLIVSDDIVISNEELSQWSYITKATTGDNTITFRCNKTKPTIELNFKVKVV